MPSIFQRQFIVVPILIFLTNLYRVCFVIVWMWWCGCANAFRIEQTRVLVVPFHLYYVFIIGIISYFFQKGLINKRKMYTFVMCVCFHLFCLKRWISLMSEMCVWENFRTFFIHSIHRRNKCLKCILYKIFKEGIKCKPNLQINSKRIVQKY